MARGKMLTHDALTGTKGLLKVPARAPRMRTSSAIHASRIDSHSLWSLRSGQSLAAGVLGIAMTSQ